MTAAGDHTCRECGARYVDAADSCAARFDRLLALDHSREEPWGSRHGLAFAVFALQHPARFGAGTAERSEEMVRRVYEGGEPLEAVVRNLRRAPLRAGDVPERADAAAAAMIAPRAFSVTIADLGTFDADRYAAQLDDWCRATLAAINTGRSAP